MRKDIQKKENTFNLIIIILFIFASTGLLNLFFLKNYKNSKNIYNIENKLSKIEQFFLKKNKNSNSIEDLISEIYFGQTSTEIGVYSEEEVKKKITTIFDKKKFFQLLKDISNTTNMNIETYDYIQYYEIFMRKELFKELINIFFLKDESLNLLNNSISFNKNKIIKGYKVTIPCNIKEKKFTKKEIKDFIFEQKLKKNIHYITPEKRSGYIIKIKLSGASQNVISAVNYFLKHQEFNKEKLEKFLITYAQHTQNFIKIFNIDYKVILNESRNIVKSNNFNIHDYISIEEYTNVIKNEKTKLLFQKECNKTFILVEDEYVRGNIIEVIKEKNIEISEEFLKEFILRSMYTIYKQDQNLKNYYNYLIDHNIKKINLLDSSYKKELISISNKSEIYNSICFSKTGDAFILYDILSNPFIFVITEIVLENNSDINIQYLDQYKAYIAKNYKNFIEREVFLTIFQLAFNKLKNSVAH